MTKTLSLTAALALLALAGCAAQGGGGMMVRPAGSQNSSTVKCLEGQIAEGDHCVDIRR